MRLELRKRAAGAAGISEDSDPRVFCFHLHILHTPHPAAGSEKSDTSGSLKEEENHTEDRTRPRRAPGYHGAVFLERPLRDIRRDSTSCPHICQSPRDGPALCNHWGMASERQTDRQSTATHRPSASSPPSQRPSLAQGVLGNSGHPGPGD